MNLEDYLVEKRRRVDALLADLFKEDYPAFPRLFEAMRYSLLAGGKRIRPILTVAAYEACRPNGDHSERDEAALRVGSAIEMIHTYSLIHDDLPAMDNDDLRRGRPTNHKAFGEATAILAGDSLLTESFQVIARSRGVPAEVLLQIVDDIADASGPRGMAGGQSMDLECEHRKISQAELETLHRHKTGALIRVSVVAGAKIGGADPKVQAALTAYGEAIGISFQIADDILDVEGGSQEMGKATGGDALKEKATYPSILGLETSKRLAQDWTDRALQALSSFDERADPLRGIAKFIISRRA